jgi:exopolysaccharide biosynthesis protein
MLKSFLIPGVFLIPGIFFGVISYGQVQWQNVDSLYQPLPASVHVYKTTKLLNGKPNIAFYVEADLKDKKLDFTADTTFKRRLTLSKFYEKNEQSLLVVNCTFFSFATNQNLNVVIKKGKMVSYNVHTINGRGKDTFTYKHPYGSAIGISKKREVDISWLLTDSLKKYAYSVPWPGNFKDSLNFLDIRNIIDKTRLHNSHSQKALKIILKWKMQTAVGGGPVLLQNGEIKITNNEELKFTGKAIDDKHPRTGMGYTADHKLIIMVIQGRLPGIAEGASLTQEAQLFKDIGCVEALNLDGGGSSCMLVNGKETIKPSDKEGQRPVPAVFIIKKK